MLPALRRWILSVLLAILAVTTVFRLIRQANGVDKQSVAISSTRPSLLRTNFKWRNIPQRYPVETLAEPPIAPVVSTPQIQASFKPETYEERLERERRRHVVEEAFLHSWRGYKSHAWLQDEVAPLSGESSNDFGGWGATLVDSLDTLWIMGLEKEFSSAVSELEKIDFTSSALEILNVFETTIRYLGGFLSAYDVSGHRYKVLLEKAVELGEMLYLAFDTPNRMPVTRWDWKHGASGGEQESSMHSLLAEVGSMSLEFTRLSQLTGDLKWYDAISRVTDALYSWQNHTKIPGLWPVLLDTRNLDFWKDITFTFGGQADSTYEYLPKQYLMLGGLNKQYREMYLTALQSAKQNLFFQPLNPNNQKLQIPGTLKRHSAGNVNLVPQGQHLSCFAGGMVALGAKIFEQPEELDTARQLVEGCLWAYETMPSGIMPEIFTAIQCHDGDFSNCTWSEENWHDGVSAHINKDALIDPQPVESAQRVIMQNNLPTGMVDIPDSRYLLRPEAIESVFVLYRITGDKTLQDRAWKMFQAIETATKTEIAYASIKDVNEEQPELLDSMESFWTAETLKYFYLMFSEPDLLSLDDYILNTEAHPLLRPK